ncbi:MAG: hypothetical protein ABIH34_03775 [Nanoarchaeota archaeon]
MAEKQRKIPAVIGMILILFTLIFISACGEPPRLAPDDPKTAPDDPKTTCDADTDCEYRSCIGCYNKESEARHYCPKESVCECFGPFEDVECSCDQGLCKIKSIQGRLVE